MDDVARALIDTVSFDAQDRAHIEILDAILEAPDTTRARFLISSIRQSAMDRLMQWRYA